MPKGHKRHDNKGEGYSSCGVINYETKILIKNLKETERDAKFYSGNKT